MDAWEKWWNMAQESLKAAQLLAVQGETRSSASRAYYAAYQAVTALLLYYKMTPPEGREAWNHGETPELIWKLSGAATTQDARKDVASRLVVCYNLRLTADYIGREEVKEIALKTSLKNASFIVRLAKDVLQ